MPVRGADAGRRGPARQPLDEDEDEGTSPLVWIAGIVAIALLARSPSSCSSCCPGRTSPPRPSEVTVPDFVGTLLADATGEADGLGLMLESTERAESDQPVGTILAQDPPAGTVVEAGATVRVTVAAGLEQVPMPDLRNKTEAQAVQEIVTAGLVPGSRPRLRPDRADRPRRHAEPGPGRRRRQGQRRRLRRLEGSRADAQPDADPHTDPDARRRHRPRRRRPTPTPTPDPDPDTDPDADRRPTSDPDQRLGVAPQAPARLVPARLGGRGHEPPAADGARPPSTC